MADIVLTAIGVSPLEVLIPVWFYIFSGLAYFASAAISLSVSYFALRTYRKIKSKKFLLIGLAFLILGISHLVLTLSSIYTYFYVPLFSESLGIPLGSFNNTAFNFYYLTSLISYLMLFVTYVPMNELKKMYVLYVPLWFTSLEGFHMASIFLITFIILRSIHNFYRLRSLNSFLVLLSFILMAVFHLTTLLLPFDLTLYLLSHIVLAAGFASLLAMLIRVSRSG